MHTPSPSESKVVVHCTAAERASSSAWRMRSSARTVASSSDESTLRQVAVRAAIQPSTLFSGRM
jgi:hypothetical protein